MIVRPAILRLFTMLAVIVLLPLRLDAVEINGIVSSATPEYATVTSDSGLIPTPGDKAEIFFKMEGLDVEVSVATGQVYEVTGANIMIKIDKATATVAKDQLARISSPNPRKLPQVQPHAPPAEPNVQPKKGTATTVDFNNLAPGPLSPEAFADRGVHLKPGKGNPGIYQAAPNMVMAAKYRNVLLIADERETALTFEFDAPIKRFAVLRVGTAGGASTPTWKMKAYDKNGKVVGTAGEKHGIPGTPKPFSVQGRGITRVEITTDNRNGAGTWATWSSLPIAAIAFDSGIPQPAPVAPDASE